MTAMYFYDSFVGRGSTASNTYFSFKENHLELNFPDMVVLTKHYWRRHLQTPHTHLRFEEKKLCNCESVRNVVAKKIFKRWVESLRNPFFAKTA